MWGLNIELPLKKSLFVILNFFKILLFIVYRLFVDFVSQKRLQTFLFWLVIFFVKTENFDSDDVTMT